MKYVMSDETYHMCKVSHAFIFRNLFIFLIPECIQLLGVCEGLVA